MIVVLLIYLFICFYDVKFGDHEDYLSKEKTQSIKGIFILLVFFSHFNSYVVYTNQMDLLWQRLITSFGQTMVTLFLFYSGYGVMYSIIHKGNEYVNSIPYKRFFLTLIKFDLAVFIFTFIKILFNESFSLQTFLLSLIGFDSMGNSNWYIFTILILYLCTYVSFNLFKNKNLYACLFQILLTCSYICIMHFCFQKELYWYDTAACYNVGMFFALYKNKINQILSNKKIYLFLLTFFFTITFFFRLMLTNVLIDILLMISFSILIILLSRKISLNNKILNWMGNYLFEIYVLQRIPMIILSKSSIFVQNIYLFFILCFIATILLAIIYRYFTDKIVNQLNKLIIN